MRRILALTFLAACGGAPLLHGLPQPNAVAAASIAAAVAGAATIANPGAAGHIAEMGKATNLEGDNSNRETMPNDLLDGLEEDRRPNIDDALGAPPPPDEDDGNTTSPPR